MTTHTTVATANVLRTLRDPDARTTLRALLDGSPDLVALQEWGPARRRLLGETGPVRRLGRRVRGVRPLDGPGYLWLTMLLGEGAVGLRLDRYTLLDARTRVLARPGRAERGVRTPPVAPPRLVTVAVLHDRLAGDEVTLVNYHLTPAVERRGGYRDDRPLLVGHHRAEVRALTRVVAGELTRGRRVYAVGDSNFHDLQLPGLTSAWEGHRDQGGTFGRRRIDDVHGPGPADSLRLLTNASDHRALVVRRTDPE